MVFIAVTSQTPPTVGNSKKLWSPDLFNTINGDYPISPLPSVVHYPVDGSGKMSFFESFISGRIWPTGDSGGGAYAWDEQDVTPPNFLTYYEDSATESSDDTPGTGGTTTISKIFTFTGVIPASIANPTIKIVYDLSGTASVSGSTENLALATLIAAISTNNGSSFTTINPQVDGFVANHIDPSVTYDSGKITYSHALSQIITFSQFQIKLSFIVTANSVKPPLGSGTADVSADVKVYALYLE
jgi:hypothetical protein